MTLAKSMLAGVTALALSSGVAAAAVATTDLNLRAGPGTGSSVIGVIPDGARVAILDCTGSWCRVNYNGEMGYASAAYLEGSQSVGVGVAVAPTYVNPAPYDAWAYGYEEPYGYEDYGYYNSPSIGFGLSFGDGGHRHHGGWHGGTSHAWQGGGGHAWHNGGTHHAWHGGGMNHAGRGNPGREAWHAQASVGGVGGGAHFGGGHGGMHFGGGGHGGGADHFGHAGGSAALGGGHGGGGHGGGGHGGGGPQAHR
jgi:uncharacterized protein YraI